MPEGVEALGQDLLAVRHEQQAHLPALLAQAPVVERRDDGLAGAGRRDDEVLVAPVPLALDGELLEHLPLVGPGFEVEEEEGVSGCLPLLRRYGAVEPRSVPLRVVGLVFGALPVGVEGRIELLEDVGRSHLGEADVPLDAVDEGRLRQVGGADVGGRVAGVAPEHPGLGVEARGLGVVGDLDLRADLDQPVDRLALGGAGEDGGDDAELPSACAVGLELLFEEPQAVPADEGAEQVDRVRGRDLSRQRMGERGLAAGVDEEVGGGERD